MENKSGSGGLGFFGALGILFIALKFCGVIDWPWVAVLAPIWVPFALAFIILVIIETIAILAER